MPIVSNHIWLSPAEVYFLLLHVGFTPDQALIFTCLSLLENDGNTGSYRLAVDNILGGDDLGLLSANTKAHEARIGVDRYKQFDIIFHLRTIRAIFQAAGNSYGAWNYGPDAYGPKIKPPGTPRPARTDEELQIATVRAMVGNGVNPYHRLKRAGINTYDLPVPPNEYVSILPQSNLKYGNMFPQAGQAGDDLNRLQRILDSMGRWGRPGRYDRSYFDTVAGLGAHAGKGIRSIQLDLKSIGLLPASYVADGKVYDAILRNAWDNAMKAEFMGLVV